MLEKCKAKEESGKSKREEREEGEDIKMGKKMIGRQKNIKGEKIKTFRSRRKTKTRNIGPRERKDTERKKRKTKKQELKKGKQET